MRPIGSVHAFRCLGGRCCLLTEVRVRHSRRVLRVRSQQPFFLRCARSRLDSTRTAHCHVFALENVLLPSTHSIMWKHTIALTQRTRMRAFRTIPLTPQLTVTSDTSPKASDSGLFGICLPCVLTDLFQRTATVRTRPLTLQRPCSTSHLQSAQQVSARQSAVRFCYISRSLLRCFGKCVDARNPVVENSESRRGMNVACRRKPSTLSQLRRVKCRSRVPRSPHMDVALPRGRLPEVGARRAARRLCGLHPRTLARRLPRAMHSCR